MINKVLIIDDDVNMIETLESFLELYGVKKNNILKAEDPIDALEIFKQHKLSINLVICDYYMPKSNGAELCEVIKKNQPKIQIIMQTGDQNLKLKDFSFISKFLYKPYDFENFEEVINQIEYEADNKPKVEIEKRYEDGIYNVASIKFMGANDFLHALVINQSEGGCRIALKPNSEIRENKIIEFYPSSFSKNEMSFIKEKPLKAEIIWIKLVNVDLCVLGLQFVV